MIWEGVLIPLDSSVCGFDISGFERRFAYNQSVDDNSKRPDVNLIRMPSSSFQNLWSNVVWCSANGSFLLSVKVELGRKSEVSKFDLHFIIQKEVS